MDKLHSQHENDIRTKKTLEQSKIKLVSALESQDQRHYEELDRLWMVCNSLKNTKKEFEILVTVSFAYAFFWFIGFSLQLV